MLKKRPHTPAHLLLDDMHYFITGAIYGKRHLLKSPELKQLLLATMESCFKRFGWKLQDWVILDNHYHLMALSRRGSDLPRIMQCIHGSTSQPIRVATGAEKPVWWNYWDYCPRDESDYYIRLNYLLWNPVKHGYVEKPEAYPFSSYAQLIHEKGASAVVRQFREHPEFQTWVLEETDDPGF